MKGIVLGGGLGTRLYPLTRFFNKHSLPVYDQPILFYAIKTIIDAGIRDIVIVTGPPFGQQVKDLVTLYPGHDRTKFSFVLQKKPLGIPDAIAKCEELIEKNSVMVVPGDNLFVESFKEDVKGFKDGALAFLREVDDLTRFGVAKFENNKLVDIVEKPNKPPSKLAVIAPYIFDHKVFNLIKCLRPSERGELEIVDLMKIYLGFDKLNLVKKTGYWKDVGTFDALLEAGLEMRKLKKRATQISQ